MFDFDAEIDRRHTGSLKWDVKPGELPMWVADMDFETAPSVKEALLERASHGVYGYAMPGADWYQAYMDWWRERHGLTVKKEWLQFTTGVVPAISSLVRKLTTVGENVLVLTPVYNIFFNSICNNGRCPLESPLLYENGTYRIDFADLERKLADPQTTMLLFCNPHNPIGKIWDAQTIEQIGDLCMKHHVVVVADEIHCDLTEPGRSYVPFAGVSDVCRSISVTCVAPTKTFNLAGVQTAAVIVPDSTLRHKVKRGLNTDEVAEPNVFALTAATAAFRTGGEWLDALRAYLWENRMLAERWVRERIPGVDAVHGEATYLLWLDCRKVTNDSRAFCLRIRKETGLILSNGAQYHDGGGFLRMNLACRRAVLQDGLERLERAVRGMEIV